MKLHDNPKLFSDTIRASAAHLKINEIFIEKDYWISYVLRQLAKSDYADNVVFKGGTSLSKGYNLINRFSEDVDIAVVNAGQYTGNQLKDLIRDIEKEMTKGLNELNIKGITSKKSRNRKAIFEYSSIDTRNKSNRLIVEVNSYANPYPFNCRIIESYISQFLKKTGNSEYIEMYDLEEFEINVLDVKQTLIEKVVSLIRHSLHENPIPAINSKIRHFYDIYFLLSENECKIFIQTDDFVKQFNGVLKHDRIAFDEPRGWNKKSLKDSQLITNFEYIWNQIKDTYKKELEALAFKEIPSEKEIAEKFKILINLIEKH